MKPTRHNHRLAAANAVRCNFALCVLLCAGCSGTKIFTPKTLPAGWAAIPTSNTQTLDLTKLASASMPEDRIAKGDVLEITVAAGSSRDDISTMPSRVNNDGTVEVLHVGPVPVAGLDTAEAQGAILQACIDREIYRAPLVTVTMKHAKVNRVTVTGGVEKPQTVFLRSGNSDLLQAISAAGGLSKDAGTLVEIRHPGFRPGSGDSSAPVAIRGNDGVNPAGYEKTGVRPATGATSHRINLASLGKEEPSAYELDDGAVVSVEKRDPPGLQVLGLVQKPNRYDFPVGKNLHLLDAISVAGGTSNPMADKVFIIRRRDEKNEPALIQVSMRAAKRKGRDNILLEPGDTVTVEQTPQTVFMELIKAVGINLGGQILPRN